MRPEATSSPVEKSSAQEQLHEVEAILEIKRDELKPAIRKYADNLHAQILEDYKEFGVKDSEEFEAAARAGTVPTKKLRDLVALTEKLAQVLETGEEKEVAEALRLINLAKETVEQIKWEGDFERGYHAEAYATIARAEQQAGLEFSQSLKQAKTATDNIEGEVGQSNVYLDIIGTELAAGKFDQAEDTTKRIEVDRYRELANIAIVLARGDADRFERAKAITEGIRIDDESDYEKKIFPYAFANIALAEAKAGKDPTQSFEKALSAARKLKNKKHPLVTPKTYLYLIRTEAKAGRFDLAKKTSEELTDSAAVLAFADIAFAEAKAGQDYHATIQLAHKTANKIEYDNYLERKIGFSHLAQTEARLGDFDGARITAQILDIANSALCLTNIALIESETGHNPTKSLESAKTAARKTEEPTQGKLNSRFEAWVRIAEVEADLGLDSTESLNQAKESFRKWDFRKDDNVWNPYFPLIRAEVKAGNIEQAKNMADELVADARSRAYHEIIMAQSNTYKFEQVEALIKEIKKGLDLKGVVEDLAMAGAEKIKGGVIESDFLADFHNFQVS